MKLASILSMCVVIGCLALPAAAGPKTGEFWAAMEGNYENWNMLDPARSGGSGYTSSGPWYEYPCDGNQHDPWGNSNPVPSWMNQWYYDDPYDPTRWKEITLTFKYGLNDPNANGGSYIVINYSTPAWSPNPGAPPMSNEDPNDPNVLWIGRIELDQLWIPAGDPNVYSWSQTYDLRTYGIDFNPEWISIDIAGYNFLLSSPTEPGTLIHECVPEPVTISLLALGGGLLIRRRRRRG